MIYLTILNTLLIIYLFIDKTSKLFFEFCKETSIRNNTLLGFSLELWKRTSKHTSSMIFRVYLPIRNKRKTEMREEALYMIARYSPEMKIYSLTSKFSWLKTWDEVKEFQKYYTIVDERTVKDLVDGYVSNMKFNYK